MKKRIYFKNFENYKRGLMVSHHYEWETFYNSEEELELTGFALIWARNPYGTHNLVLCAWDDELEEWFAIRHGTIASLKFLWEHDYPLYKKGVRFLTKYGEKKDFRGFCECEEETTKIVVPKSPDKDISYEDDISVDEIIVDDVEALLRFGIIPEDVA